MYYQCTTTGRLSLNIVLFLSIFLVSFSRSVTAATTTASAYKNHTVGDSLGWYDTLENPKVDYQKWVAGKNFSLGDFLSKSLQQLKHERSC